MTNNFQKTVDLKDRMKPKIEPKKSAKLAKTKKKRPSRAQGIDQVYSEEKEEPKLNSFQKIERAPSSSRGQGVYKFFTIIFGLILLVVLYFAYLAPNKEGAKSTDGNVIKWYAVQLINNETYYGQIIDTSADPIIVNKVYYNYDQLNTSENEVEKNNSGNLRLIKRGKETYGPAGEMSIVRAQVLFMEPLKEDSMVLKAILDYEK